MMCTKLQKQLNLLEERLLVKLDQYLVTEQKSHHVWIPMVGKRYASIVIFKITSNMLFESEHWRKGEVAAL